RLIIEQSDHDRIGFHRYFFDIDWKDPSNYHITLNTGNLHPALAAGIIKELRDRVIGPDKESASIIRLKEMILGQRIVHHVLYKKEIPIHFLEAVVSEGNVTLFGVTNSQALVETVVAAVKEFTDGAGVTGIQSEIQVVREYSVVP
ncbi:MAG: BON domain-containing protein, partial [Treponema sp.]|nr:BON domain-containing protein [Treponema sp.]